MLTLIIKRTHEPTVVQLTQENMIRELTSVNGSELLLETSWRQGLKKVRTPYVCLVEDDCVLSSNYLAQNFGIMKRLTHRENSKGGGYNRLAVLASCLGVGKFDNRIYNYRLEHEAPEGDFRVAPEEAVLGGWKIRPNRNKLSTESYNVQIAFMMGAVIRYASIKDAIDSIPWEIDDLVELSALISFYFWGTNRFVNVNPNTTYVSNEGYLEKPVCNVEVPERVGNIFNNAGIS